MPRDVKIRTAGYQADIAYLSRLARAIDKDPQISDRSKGKARREVNALIILLINLEPKP